MSERIRLSPPESCSAKSSASSRWSHRRGRRSRSSCRSLGCSRISICSGRSTRCSFAWRRRADSETDVATCAAPLGRGQLRRSRAEDASEPRGASRHPRESHRPACRRRGHVPSAAAAQADKLTVGALTYLANSIRVRGREIPYSLIAAIDLEAYDRHRGLTPLSPTAGAERAEAARLPAADSAERVGADRSRRSLAIGSRSTTSSGPTRTASARVGPSASQASCR